MADSDDLAHQIDRASTFVKRLLARAKSGLTLEPGYHTSGYDQALTEVEALIQKASGQGPGKVRQRMNDYRKEAEAQFEGLEYELFSAGIGAVGGILVWNQLNAKLASRAAYAPFEPQIPYDSLQGSPV